MQYQLFQPLLDSLGLVVAVAAMRLRTMSCGFWFFVRCCILLRPSIWLLQPADRMLTRVVLVGCCSRCRDNACSVQLRLGCCSRAHTNDVGWLLQPVVWTCICVLMGCFQPVCIFPLQRAHTLSGRRCRYLWPLSAVTAGAWFTWSSGCRLAQIS